MIAIPFVAVGLIKSLALNIRVRQLCLAYSFFLEIKQSVRYTGAEMGSIVDSLFKKSEYASLNKNFSTFKKQEAELLKNALSGLGRTDTYGQLQYIDAVLQKLEGIINSAEKDCNDKARLYRMLGLCGGAAVAIIIM